jgi:hypothetical protein
MASEDIYKYLGLAIVIVFVAYIIIKSLTFQARMIEGMKSKDDVDVATDKDKKPEAIKSNTNTILDSLLIDKYRPSYDDTIIELEENISATILAGILKNAENISADPSSEKSQQFITAINNLKTFKDTLNDAMKYLDGIKSSGAGKLATGGKWF